MARILDSSDRPVGTGFLVGPQMVATCAHSVAAAIGGDPHSLLRPYVPVGVDFPWRAPGSRVVARVRGWVPEYAEGCGDIAVLEFDAAPPAAASPPSMRGADGMTVTGFRMLGVRNSGFGIVAVRGDFRTPASGMSVVALEVAHHMPPISDCCSGAPYGTAGRTQ